MFAPLLLALLQQQPAATPAAAAPPSPVARIAVMPEHPVVVAGDTLRLAAQALDSAGQPVPGATVRWFGAGGRFEGRVDPTGLVSGGSTGMLVARGVATVPGRAPSRPAIVVIRVVPPPAAAIVVAPAVSRLLAGQRVTLTATVLAANGDRRADPVRWTSSAPGVARVERDGRLVARASGRATITATAGATTATLAVTVVPNTIRRLEITGGVAEARTGDVLRFHVVARDAAGREVEGVSPAWALTPGNGVIDQDGVFVADAAGDYVVTARFGDLGVETAVRVRHREVRRPTTTVGRLALTRLPAAEFWPHPDGRHAYLSTAADRVYALDIGDPANLRITDSIVVDARTVNDVMTTADGRWGVLTREGASSRRNGIVILDCQDPAHPRPVSEYTETVTGGVHSTYIYTQPRYGTHIYLTDDATGSLRVVDINDPLHPREVARWQTRANLAGNYVHDVDIVDGLAYLSYWNDGLVILDIGNGIKSGTPTNPQLVGQLKYDLDDLYRSVQAEGGPGFIRGTHTAWRDRRRPYVYVGDEVFSARPLGIVMPNRMELGKANGRLHVIDVSDLAHPREVAWFEPPDGGSHNVWVAGDTLYLGDYQGGLRVLDVSGELKGDLLEQDREIAHLHTGDANGMLPNAAMAWGAFYHNGLVWVNDMFSGLWAVRVEPREEGRRAEPGVP